MIADSLLLQALVYLAAGVIAAPIAKRLGLSSVLGYLVAGALVGPFALDLVGEAEDVLAFAEFGVVILLFLIGLEVRPALLWQMRTSILGLGAGQMAATTALVGAAALAMGVAPAPALALGLILSMSSTAIVLQNLEERGLRQGSVGHGAFGVLLFQDFAVIPMFAFLPLLAAGGVPAHVEGGHGASLLDGQPQWVVILATFGAVAAVVVGGRYLTRPVFRFIAASRLREIFTASALLLVVGVAALMEVVGLSPALGAFLAGVVLAESEFRRELETDIEPFRGLLLGLFFISVGAGLDLGLVASQPVFLISAVIVLMVLKFAAMFAVGLVFRRSRRDAATIAVALAQGGEFAFVLFAFTGAAGVLDAATIGPATAVVALSMALTPVAFALHQKLVLDRAVSRPEPERLPFDEGEPDAIIAGFGRVGQIATRLLIANDFKVVLLDSSIDQLELIRRFGWRVHYGDASRLDLLRSAGADKAKLLVVAIDDREKANEIVELAKQAFPHLSIVARAYDRTHAYELMEAGADKVEREAYEGSLLIGRRALELLGHSERRALKAAALFREHDLALFHRLRPAYGDDDRYLEATKASRETFERLLSEEMKRVAEEDEQEAAERLEAAPRRV